MPDRSLLEEKYLLCRRLEAVVDEMLEGEFNLSSDYQRLAFAFVCKSAKSYRAALRLVEQGLGEPALILVRSIFDDLVNLAYVSKDPDVRTDLFLEFSQLEKKRHLDNLEKAARVNKKYYSQLKELRAVWEKEFRGEYLKALPKFRKRAGWSGKTLREMAAGDAELTELYYTLYLYASGYAHGNSALALESYVRPVEPLRLASLAHPSETELLTALELGFDVFMRCIKVFTEASRLDRSRLDALTQEMDARH